MEITTIEVYRTYEEHAETLRLDVDAFYTDIRRAAYRFWVSERRMPAAVVMSLQLAQAFTSGGGVLVGGELLHFGLIALDEITVVPLLARPAALDPLFQFI